MLENLDPDAPYALGSELERSRRHDLLASEHMAPLVEYVAELRSEQGAEYGIPSFDPCDGGVNASALFLLEAPGPRSVNSTFISRNNPDPTARNICHLLKEAGIDRRDTVIWNVVPWYVGDEAKIRPVNRADLRASMPYLEKLLGILPKLKVIILVGRKPQLVIKEVSELTNVPILKSYHTSNLSLNGAPDRRGLVLDSFRQAARVIKNATHAA